ncbi:hypothetical protein [Nocardia arizonensis]|uniref:hypothetical protein n=1 Tax=Nocardia arizonensis TaxID=1141647 RepID=UPI0006D00966|nr:hypothetical protein [Nocardia arizonensis]
MKYTCGLDGDWEEGAWTCRTCRGRGDDPASTIEIAPSREQVLALDDAVDAMVEAEEYAWEIVARLRVWGLGTVDRLIWRVGNRAFHAEGPTLSGLPYELESRFDDSWRHYESELADADRLVPATRFTDREFRPPREVRQHARWNRAAELELRVPEGEVPAGLSFADLPNPYTPLLRMWLAGFGLDRIEDGAVILYAPPRMGTEDVAEEPTVQPPTNWAATHSKPTTGFLARLGRVLRSRRSHRRPFPPNTDNDQEGMTTMASQGFRTRSSP